MTTMTINKTNYFDKFLILQKMISEYDTITISATPAPSDEDISHLKKAKEDYKNWINICSQSDLDDLMKKRWLIIYSLSTK
jgi:hypothetical protein